MTQIFTDDGRAVPATVISVAGGNVVTAVRTAEKDGYTAVQVGYGECKEKALSKPELGHLAKAGAPPLRSLVEFRVASADGYEPGTALSLADTFKVGDVVDVAGTSIGKGFQGSIKRWNFKRGLMSHGSKSKRQHGSIGSSATPSRVLPGLKMAGRMGGERVKIRGLEILSVDEELNAIVVKGSLPGKPGSCVLEITQAKKVGKNC
jgi:large subunit ribosomal protein L3